MDPFALPPATDQPMLFFAWVTYPVPGVGLLPSAYPKHVGSVQPAKVVVVPSQTMNSTWGGGNVSAVGEELLMRNSSASTVPAPRSNTAPAIAPTCRLIITVSP